MSKHTPGPWRMEVVKVMHGMSIDVYAPDGKRIVKDLPNSDEANARLIAAAPELLNVCEQISKSNCCCDDLPESDQWVCPKCMADKAIAKAKGT